MSYRFVDSCRAGAYAYKLVRLVGFITKKFVTMHGNMNVKFVYKGSWLLFSFCITATWYAKRKI